MLQYKNYAVPQTIEELFRLLERNDGAVDIVSGGTDCFAREKDSSRHPDAAIDISRIEAFSRIERKGDVLVIGANTRIQQFLNNQELIECVPMLRHAASYFADQQIRESATIGGNLANASPTGDMIPPLLALNAVVHTLRLEAGKTGGRDIPVSNFIQGVGKTPLARSEVIASVSCPVLEGYGCAFKKVGLRRSLCISTVNSAFLVKVDSSGRYFEDVRIAFGGIAPAPARLRAVEEKLKGARISKAQIQEMADYIPDDIVRSRSRQEYRKTVVRNFLTAGLSESLAEIGILPE